MNFFFLMDPISKINPKKDTTYAFMCGAHRRGHKVYYVPNGGLSILSQNKSQNVYIRAIEVIPQENAETPFKIFGEPNVYSTQDVDAIFVRTDPPFDTDYLHNMWVLDHIPKHIPIMNRPEGIRTVNEKIWVTQFPKITPDTLICRHITAFKEFLEQHKHIIVKPTDGYGGQAIFQLEHGDKNTNVLFETLSNCGTTPIILQRYVPEANLGDKRILLLDGDPLGALLRVHTKEDHRNNFFSGGVPKKTTITENDKKIIKILKPYLKKLGLSFVGIDIIGDYLIELNVTSPTCIQEMNMLHSKNFEDKVIRFTEKEVKRLKKN